MYRYVLRRGCPISRSKPLAKVPTDGPNRRPVGCWQGVAEQPLRAMETTAEKSELPDQAPEAPDARREQHGSDCTTCSSGVASAMAAVGEGTNSSSGVVINGGRKSSSGPIAPSEPGGRLSHAQSDAASASLKCRASAGSQQSAGPRLFTHPDSSATGYKPGPLGEWAMLNELHYDEERPDACTCWLRVQAAATVQSVRTAQNNKLLRVCKSPVSLRYDA